MNSTKAKFLYRCFIVILGNSLLGLGTGLLRNVNFGVDPFSGMTLGVSYFLRGQLHLEFMTAGVFQVILNLVLILAVLFYNRSYIGFGLVFNMFFLGFICDGSEWLWIQILGTPSGIVYRIFLLIAGVILISMGVGVYSSAHLGMGPYDALAYIITQKTHDKIHVRYTRIMTDVICVIIGFLGALSVGKQVKVTGIATVILALGLGPLIYFFRVQLGEKILLKNVLD